MSRDIRPAEQWPKAKESIAAPAVVSAFLIEVAPDEFKLTTLRDAATHGLIDTSGLGDWRITPLAELDGTARIRRIGTDTYRAY